MSVATDPPQAPKKPPVWRRPNVLNLLLIALFAELAYATLNIAAMPVYLKDDRGFGEGTIGFVIVAFLLSEALFKSPMGSLADRFGRKRLMVIGPLITVFTAIASLFIPHDIGDAETWIFIGLRALDGLGVAMIWPAAFAFIGESVGEDQKQEGMSLLNMCYLVGIALALLVSGVTDDLIGLTTADGARSHVPSLYLAAGICLTVSIFAYKFLPSGKTMREDAKQAKIDGDRHKSELAHMLQTAKQIPGFLILGAVTFMGVGFPLAIIKIFAKDEFGMSDSKFGVATLPALIAMAVLAPIMSRYGEKMGRKKAVHNGLLLCSLGLVLIAMGAFSPGLRNVWVFVVGGIPVGLGFLLTIPAWYASVSEISKERRAANIGAVMTAQGLGAIVGSLLGSQSYERLQNMETFAGFTINDSFARYSPFVGCALCVLAGWLLSLRLLRD